MKRCAGDGIEPPDPGVAAGDLAQVHRHHVHLGQEDHRGLAVGRARGHRLAAAAGDQHRAVVGHEADPRARAEQLAQHITSDIRVTVLGHIQRGGAPTAASRILGTRLGVAAVEALRDGVTGVMTAVRGNRVELAPLTEAIAIQRPADTALVDLILGLAR